MKRFFKKNLYLDNASATPINKEVLRVMNKVEKSLLANPSSIHNKGVEVRNVIEASREKVAKLINAHSDEIIFIGSGTESDALAILGVVNEFKKSIMSIPGMDKILPHIVTTNIEHPAVLENCKFLEERGEAEVTYVEVEENGIVNPKEIKKALKENTILVSVMYANNEIGTIQPIQEIAKEIRHHRKTNKFFQENSLKVHGYFSAEKFLVLGSTASQGTFKEHSFQNLSVYPIFHTDACQAMNYLETSNIEKLGVDLLTFNGSKIYGPKGVGVLYKKRKVKLSPVYSGGGQEFGLRSGTENVTTIAGLAKAFEITEKMKNREGERLTKIRDYGIDKLLSLQDKTGYKIILNGDKEKRLPNNINISIKGISSELLVIELSAKGIYVSEKSACQSDNNEGSYVIRALRGGVSLNNPYESIRISLGRKTSKQDMDYLISSFFHILIKYNKWR